MRRATKRLMRIKIARNMNAKSIGTTEKIKNELMRIKIARKRKTKSIKPLRKTKN